MNNSMFILACRYYQKGMAMFQQIKILCPNIMLLDQDELKTEKLLRDQEFRESVE